MKKETVCRYGKTVLLTLVCLMLAGCASGAETGEENRVSEGSMQSADRSELSEEAGKSANQDELSEEAEQSVRQGDSPGKAGMSADLPEGEECAEENDSSTKEEGHSRYPGQIKWQEGYRGYDPEDTIFYKTYYDDSGRERRIKYPEINMRDELEEYFQYRNISEKWDNLAQMFYDERTVKMSEEELKDLFYEHGYVLCLQSAEIEDLHVRFVEITEIGGLSLYPSRIMIQTWDERYIGLQDITSPVPRKIRSFLVVDDRESYRLIVHSSGLSGDYAVEEELSFWEYDGAAWGLVPMDLEIDTSHAHIGGEKISSDIAREELFEASYYRDGIAYRPARQSLGDNKITVRPGKMEEIEKNRIFRLTAVYEAETGTTVCSDGTYIQFEIKQGFASWGRKEFRLHDERYDAYINYPQLSGMEDPEKEKRLNALIEADVMKVLEDGESDDEYRTSVGFDYEIKYIDDRIISILYKGWYGAIMPGTGSPAVAMATTVDVEEEKILTLEDVVRDYDKLHELLLTDQFENTTMWDGESGQHTVSQEYEYKAGTLMEDLRGDDEDIEWYVDDGHFVIVTLWGMEDYDEYAIRLRNAEGFLRKDFLEMIDQEM